MFFICKLMFLSSMQSTHKDGSFCTISITVTAGIHIVPLHSNSRGEQKTADPNYSVPLFSYRRTAADPEIHLGHIFCVGSIVSLLLLQHYLVYLW